MLKVWKPKCCYDENSQLYYCELQWYATHLFYLSHAGIWLLALFLPCILYLVWQSWNLAPNSAEFLQIPNSSYLARLIKTLYPKFIKFCQEGRRNIRLYVLAMSRTCFRVNPHSTVAWISSSSLLEAGAKSDV